MMFSYTVERLRMRQRLRRELKRLVAERQLVAESINGKMLLIKRLPLKHPERQLLQIELKPLQRRRNELNQQIDNVAKELKRL